MSDIEVTDIDGVDGWKEEVRKLLDEKHHLQMENQASQLIAAFALLANGPIQVSKEDIAKGLPGYSIYISEETEGFVTLGVEGADAEQ